MFDHFTAISAVQKIISAQEDDSGFHWSQEPPAQLEKLPQALIEDQI